MTNASELLAGTRAKQTPAGHALYWGGLAATVVVTVWLGKLARDAIRRALDGRPPAGSPP